MKGMIQHLQGGSDARRLMHQVKDNPDDADENLTKIMKTMERPLRKMIMITPNRQIKSITVYDGPEYLASKEGTTEPNVSRLGITGILKDKSAQCQVCFIDGRPVNRKAKEILGEEYDYIGGHVILYLMNGDLTEQDLAHLVKRKK